MTKVIRAAAYARYSSDNQRAASIDDQLRNCRNRAKSEGWQVLGEYADAAMSGSNANRPQYQAMLAAAGRVEFDVLVVDDLSRLTRDSVEQEQSIRRLEFHGVRIVSVSDGYDSLSKARKVHRGFKGLMNEMFLDDLRDRVHRGLSGQARKGYWCGGRPYGFRLKPILDPKQLDPYGQPARIGTVLEIDEAQAAVVRDIFQRFIDGASYRTIAAALNERGIASSGSTWKRKTRRCSGWMGSAVRVIVLNPLYTGRVRWNVSQFVRDPDTGSQKRRRRAQSEWQEFTDPALQIIDQKTFDLAQRRNHALSNPDQRLKRGGGPKYLLSGLLVCHECGAKYVMAGILSYACSSYVNGGESACANNVRIRRDVAEQQILGELRDEALSPERMRRMEADLQKKFAKRMQDAGRSGRNNAQELAQLDARIERLRHRKKVGDPDLTDDELEAGITRAEAKRRELLEIEIAGQSSRVLSILPRAAEVIRRQITEGLLEKNEAAAAKTRVMLRELFNGEIRLRRGPEPGSLYMRAEMKLDVVLRANFGGRGEAVCPLSVVPNRVTLK